MNRAQLAAAVRRLAEVPTAPYEEGGVRDTLHALLGEYGVNFQTDPFGNTLSRVRRGMPRNKIAFIAHLDQPGLRVIASKGKAVTCRLEGVVSAGSLKEAKVLFPKNGAQGKVSAVKLDKQKQPADITVQLTGKTEAPEANAFGTFDVPAFASKTHSLKVRSAGSVAAVAAVLGAVAQLARKETPCEAWGLFSRASSVGYHGTVALLLGGLVPRDLTIVALDGTPGFELGEGPVVGIADAVSPFDPRAVALVSGAASALSNGKAAHQSGVLTRPTEASAIGLFGYRAAFVGLPVKPAAKGLGPDELDARDLEATVSLLVSIAERIGAGTDDFDLLRNELVRGSEEGRQRLRSPGGPNQFAPDAL